ncbi:MAG TPA: TolC family protein [Bacteroidaceae bacterium]|nr:TolC family protein [Bacteroidaceae bacterium]
MRINTLYLLILFLVTGSLSVTAQGTLYQDVLQQISANNLQLRQLAQEKKATQTLSKTQLYLENPEMEFAYMWGAPSTEGKRTNFSISQNFDFPSLYAYKGQVAKAKQMQAVWKYKWASQDVLWKAQLSCIKLTYLRAVEDVLAQKRQEADKLVLQYKKAYELGEVNRITRNKVVLYKQKVDQDYAHITGQIKAAELALQGLNGGVAISCNDKEFTPIPLPVSFVSWLALEKNQIPVLRYLEEELAVTKAQVKVSKARALPTFKVGYAQELVDGDGFKGVTVGMSIPLFEHRYQTKAAREKVKAMQLAYQANKMTFLYQIQGLFEEASSMQEALASYRETLSGYDHLGLLRKGLELKELSLLEYIQESDYIYDAQLDYLQAEKEYMEALSELYRIKL